MAQDDYYYEIQLTNKQLIFYFMAGAAGLILSFLAGVMVGRGVDGSANAAGTEQTRAVAEEKVVTEPTPAAAPTDYSYAQRLESEKPAEGLEKPAGTAASATPPATHPALAKATPAPRAVQPTPAAAPQPTPTPARTAAATPALPKPIGTGPTAKGFAVQVGAFKDHASAEAIVKELKGRGLPAFSVAPAGHAAGFFPVRVGVYRERADAEAVQERLRGDKFQPYIIKQ
ncbi:MAG TPA: SPOR domain-containing protein [Vicinamibacteria bacterium]|nr:SPOR domain-containing protein [Vicinamibacteria bacterium]